MKIKYRFIIFIIFLLLNCCNSGNINKESNKILQYKESKEDNKNNKNNKILYYEDTLKKLQSKAISNSNNIKIKKLEIESLQCKKDSLNFFSDLSVDTSMNLNFSSDENIDNINIGISFNYPIFEGFKDELISKEIELNIKYNHELIKLKNFDIKTHIAYLFYTIQFLKKQKEILEDIKKIYNNLNLFYFIEDFNDNNNFNIINSFIDLKIKINNNNKEINNLLNELSQITLLKVNQIKIAPLKEDPKFFSMLKKSLNNISKDNLFYLLEYPSIKLIEIEKDLIANKIEKVNTKRYPYIYLNSSIYYTNSINFSIGISLYYNVFDGGKLNIERKILNNQLKKNDLKIKKEKDNLNFKLNKLINEIRYFYEELKLIKKQINMENEIIDRIVKKKQKNIEDLKKLIIYKLHYINYYKKLSKLKISYYLYTFIIKNLTIKE